jgi:hypothetical protein
MKSLILAAGTIAFFLLASGVGQAAEVDQIAQQKMIGLSKKHIRICLGAPAKRVRIGSTDIWTYPIGQTIGDSPFFSPALFMAPPFVFGADNGACNVNIVMTNGAVSQVVYHSADGGPLPLGRQCLFAVQNCTEPAPGGVVRATY